MRIPNVYVTSAVLMLSLWTATSAIGQDRASSLSLTAPEKTLDIADQFAAKNLILGSPVFIRVYKYTSEMQLWVQQGSHYALFKTYGICRWAGGLGPKHYEGDNQSPEGLYHITAADLIVNPRWDRAMNINYPNSYDRANGRTGSSILIHGKCSSVGCFAIQDANVEEVYAAVRAAIRNGQARVPVLALPFRFADVAPTVNDTLKMDNFWVDLRRADMLFDRDGIPPAAWLCDGRYYFSDRRGDSHRHAVRLPGCQPLDEPLSQREVAAAAERSRMAGVARVADTKAAVESDARTCDPKDVKCRLLRVAVASHASCPRKYPRCRVARAVYTKSVECPLKYPRCRRFVGPDPKPRSATLEKSVH